MLQHTAGERQGKDLNGMPVYTLNEGRRLGEIMSLLIRREDASVAAVRVGTQLSPGPAIPYTSLRLVGIDAVLVDSEAILEQPVSSDDAHSLDESVVGRRVLTASGEHLGNISGFWVNTADGRITAYRIHPESGLLARMASLVRNDTFEVPVEQAQALGAAALIVQDAIVAPDARP